MTQRQTAFTLVGLLAAALAVPSVMALPSKKSPNPDEKIKGLFAEGLQRQQEKRYPEAIMVYRRALRLNPDQPETLNNLGFCYKAMKDYKKAIDYYQQALRLNPKLAEAHEYLGEAYVQLGQMHLAQKEYQTLLTLDPKEAAKLKETIDQRRPATSP